MNRTPAFFELCNLENITQILICVQNCRSVYHSDVWTNHMAPRACEQQVLIALGTFRSGKC